MTYDDNFYEEEFVSEEEQDDIVESEEDDMVTQGGKGEEFIYDQVKGGHGKKHILSDLNKRKLGNHEMDEMFCNWY